MQGPGDRRDPRRGSGGGASGLAFYPPRSLRDSGWWGDEVVMLHMIKLSVGPRDVAQLAAIQAARVVSEPPLRAWTRMAPKRAAEVCDGGSIYWVIAGFVRVRQRVLAIEDAQRDDGRKCVALVLDPALVPVAARPTKAFQGWRYLKPEEAPRDVAEDVPGIDGLDALPAGLRAALAEACLI
ncbi:MAG: hypothetical protein JWO24_1785 [Rhodospirillales bacterium]|jgi:hypothetical protein|nr:hypothetical protein [Rhodospirillales bacterium]